MNQDPDRLSELRDLCDRMIEGQLDQAGRARLETLVLGDERLRREYVEILHLHSALKWSSAPRKEFSLSDLVELPEHADPELPAIPLHRNRTWLAPMLKLAAAVALLAGGAWFGIRHAGNSIRPFAHVATLTETKACRWESSALPTEPGAILGQGRLRLASGLATIVFAKGARLTLEAPADLELISADRCFLHSGAVVAHVPPPAIGFTVETNSARLVDYGTDFGITAGGDGKTQVQVFQGEVELRDRKSGQERRLLTGHSANVSDAGLVAHTTPLGEIERWSEQADAAIESAEMIRIPTTAGRGQSAYVASPGSKIHHSATLLLLKNSQNTAYHRRAFLRFDLAPIKNGSAEAASLSLAFEPTGFGYASLVQDSVFTVYGIIDESLDEWTPIGLTWENAPANREPLEPLDSEKVIRLGTFTMSQGTLDGTFGISGKALADFLNADKNGIATLVVVRSTPEALTGGVVHGFAGNQHPTLPPPTLRVKLSAAKVAER